METLEGTEPLSREQHILRWHMFASLDWRWELARQIVDGEIPDPGEMSPELSSAVDFQRRRKAGEALCTETDHRIAAALELSQQDTPLRWEIEARLLSGETDTVISSKSGVPETTIATFEPLFYDVRDHSRATDYLLGATTDFAHLRGFQNDEPRRFWAWCALAGGPIIVDQMVGLFYQARRKGDSPGLVIYLRRGACDLLIQTFVAMQVIPPEADALRFPTLSSRLQVAESSARPVAETNRIYRALVRCARQVLETGQVPDPPDWWGATNSSPTKPGDEAISTSEIPGRATDCPIRQNEEVD